MMESMEPAFAAGGLDYAMSSDMFAAQLGLGPEGAEFLNALPDEVRERVMRSFSPEGTKDGDVLGRLKASCCVRLRVYSGHGACIVRCGSFVAAWLECSTRAVSS